MRAAPTPPKIRKRESKRTRTRKGTPKTCNCAAMKARQHQAQTDANRTVASQKPNGRETPEQSTVEFDRTHKNHKTAREPHEGQANTDARTARRMSEDRRQSRPPNHKTITREPFWKPSSLFGNLARQRKYRAHGTTTKLTRRRKPEVKRGTSETKGCRRSGAAPCCLAVIKLRVAFL